MDRPTTRRRRHAASAESVSVADLLAKTTPAEMASVSAIKARAAAEATARAAAEARSRTAAPGVAVTAVTVGGEPAASAGGDEPRTSNRLARTIMVTTAAMVVCGAVTAIAVLTGERPHRLSPSTPSIGPTEIIGATVVRPDLVNEQLATGLLTVGQQTDRSDPDGALQPGEDIRADQLTPTVAEPPEPTGLPGRPPGPATPDEQVRRLIEDFYEAAESAPEKAFAMLGPLMQGEGADLASFVRGWADTNVEVQQLVVGSGGIARAVVTIAYLDGTVLRTEQLLVVSDGPDPKIVRAQLLSAHRS